MRKLILTFSIVTILVFGCITYLRFDSYGNTFEKRQNIINKNIKNQNVKILSELEFQGHIICELSSDKKYGYAMFSLNRSGDFLLNKWYMKNSNMIIDLVRIDSNSYDILMCSKPNLEYVERIVTDSKSGDVASKKIKLLGENIAIALSPDLSSYELNVRFVDKQGNIFE